MDFKALTDLRECDSLHNIFAPVFKSKDIGQDSFVSEVLDFARASTEARTKDRNDQYGTRMRPDKGRQADPLSTIIARLVSF